MAGSPDERHGLGLSWYPAAHDLWILFGLGGCDYYRTPLPVRGYAPARTHC